MKNIIIAIGMFILNLNVQAQNKVNENNPMIIGFQEYINVGNNLQSLLDSNHIFYVGVLDRKNLSEGKQGYVNKNVKSLDTFELFYNNDEFKTIPDTNNVIMTEKEFLADKDFRESDKMVNDFFSNKVNVIGYKYFDTPNSKIFKKIVVYEVATQFGRRTVETACIGQQKDGIWVIVTNW